MPVTVATDFATVVEGAENLPALGEKFLWDGAQEIAFREV